MTGGLGLLPPPTARRAVQGDSIIKVYADEPLVVDEDAPYAGGEPAPKAAAQHSPKLDQLRGLVLDAAEPAGVIGPSWPCRYAAVRQQTQAGRRASSAIAGLMVAPLTATGGRVSALIARPRQLPRFCPASAGSRGHFWAKRGTRRREPLARRAADFLRISAG